MSGDTDSSEVKPAPMPAREFPEPRVAARFTGAQRYLLGVLMFVNLFNVLDRYVINIVAEMIKRELHLSDAQLGLLTGIGFALTYSIVGISIGRLADRASRPLIVAASIGVWSMFTGITSLAQSFAHLLACRVGVAVGEAGCTPAAHALISDSVPRERRASAIAIYSIGNPLGLLIGLSIGGLAAQAYGWRVTFALAAAPGLLLALVCALTLRDPRADAAAPRAKSPSFRRALTTIGAKKTFWLVCLAYGCVLIVSTGFSIFSAPFFLRNHAAEVQDLANELGTVLGLRLAPIGFLGIALGIAFGLAGAVGTWLGGWLCDLFGSAGVKRTMWPAIGGAALSFLFYEAALHSPSTLAALGLFTSGQIAIATTVGPFFSTVQSVTPQPFRATSSAISLLVINIVGSLGPLLIGIGSDRAAVQLGEGGGLRLSMSAVAVAAICSAILFAVATRWIVSDVED